MKKNKARKGGCLKIFALLLAVAACVGGVYSYFGGFGTGESADPVEFAKYATAVEELEIPENVRVIALGEASHGNAEFQQLKLDVFKVLVGKYNVKAFGLEADFGCCEYVNRYIHGGEGTVQEAVDALGFDIYKTHQFAQIITYMRDYNATAPAGEDLRFYGFDMQRGGRTYQYLLEECRRLNVPTDQLEKLIVDGDWAAEYTYQERQAVFDDVKAQLEGNEDAVFAVQLANVLSQNCQLFAIKEFASQGNMLRDAFMFENTKWIMRQEEALGHSQIFINGHNGHMEKNASYENIGIKLNKEMGRDYYVISTDFYKSTCNLPKLDHSRIVKSFYSYNPLAKAAKKAGYDTCLLDLSKIPEDSSLKKYTTDYYYHGALNENYSIIMEIIPLSYRVLSKPEESCDAVIYVTNATPTAIGEY